MSLGKKAYKFRLKALILFWTLWALAGTLCYVLRQDTLLTVPLSQVYKWVPANCWGNLTNCGGVTCDGLASRPGEVEILLAASCYRNQDKHRQLWASLGSKASHYFFSPHFWNTWTRLQQIYLNKVNKPNKTICIDVTVNQICRNPACNLLLTF